MYDDLNVKLKEAAVYSNEIIKLAKGHDPRTFEFAKGGRKYFAIFGESYADSYMTTIESYRLLEETYRKLGDYGEIINIYKKMEEKVIPELYGNLFKKMIEKLKSQSTSQYPHSPTVTEKRQKIFIKARKTRENKQFSVYFYV